MECITCVWLWGNFVAGNRGVDRDVLRDLRGMWGGGGEQNIRISDISGNLCGLGIDCNGNGVFGGTCLWSAFQPCCYSHIRPFSSLPLLAGLSLLHTSHFFFSFFLLQTDSENSNL